jgi:hypothetical protein
MARFTSYTKKQKPDELDTLLVHDTEGSPDALKQVEIQALFEEYEIETGKSVKDLIDALKTSIAEAAIARYQ